MWLTYSRKAACKEISECVERYSLDWAMLRLLSGQGRIPVVKSDKGRHKTEEKTAYTILICVFAAGLHNVVFV